ncbi:MAG: cobalamin-dependent protein [Bacillota bacterium]|nr:cobalamin-dependent protein [Bacillota bacterium]
MMNFEDIKNAMQDLDEDALLELMQEVVDSGADAMEAVKACQEGMEGVGKLFEEGEYFVGDLIYAGEILTGAIEIIKPALSEGEGGNLGRIILCTVKDDLHDIGKNIVKSLLEAGGFEVLDLGIDTPAEKIVETAKTENIKIIALSGVLTLALDSMKATVQAFTDAGMRDDVKIIVGGAPVNEVSARNIGADAWTSSPQKTVSICRGWALGE